MRKIIYFMAAFIIIASSVHAFQIKNAAGKFEIGAGPAQSYSTGFRAQAIYNTNETFYIGVRFTGGSQFYYYSAVSHSSNNTAYLVSVNDVSMVLGARFANINERFNMYLNLLPGFAFTERETGIGLDVNQGYGSAALSKVNGTESPVFFSPAFELGFTCHLTDNLMISTGWEIKQVKVKDMEWVHYPWLIKLGDQDAVAFYIPVVLSWRF
jgi:hypothetical protein